MTKHSRLTVKGQVTVPKDVRDQLGVKPGDRVAFEREGDRIVLRKAAVEPVDVEAAKAAFRAKLELALKLYPPLPMDMTTDEYMALIRDPVVLPRDGDV